MNTTIQTFTNKDFGTIRTMVNENGETFFVAKDVATALGYTKTRNAVAAHVSKEDRATALIQGPTSNHASHTVVINESGLYALIFGSQLPSAKAFKRWVTSEVLPQIRRTGGYIPTRNARTGEKLSESQIIQVAEDIMLKTISKQNAPADGCLSATEVAKMLGYEVKDFYLLLDAAGIIQWKAGRYRLTSAYADQGLAQDRNFHYFALGGTKKQRPYLVWTAAGVDFIKDLMSNH